MGTKAKMAPPAASDTALLKSLTADLKKDLHLGGGGQDLQWWISNLVQFTVCDTGKWCGTHSSNAPHKKTNTLVANGMLGSPKMRTHYFMAC